MNLIQIVILALIQGAAELLPVSSSAHVILAEKWMGLDPSSPELTFLLVMLHTGTMLAVIVSFWSRWKKLDFQFLKLAVYATAVTGIVGLGLKKIIEIGIIGPILGEANPEIEHLFKSLPFIAASLFSVGLLIVYAGSREGKAGKTKLTSKVALRIGLTQALCLPFRGFSRSGATISVSLLSGISKPIAESFSFALAVLLTPSVILLEVRRLIKASQMTGNSVSQWLEIKLIPSPSTYFLK